MVLFTADLQGASTQVPAHKGVDLEWLGQNGPAPAGISQYADTAGVDQRLARGDGCLIGRDATTGGLVYHLWVTESGAYLDWIFAAVTPRPQELLVYDVWLGENHRGGPAHWAAAALTCQEAMRRGRRYILAGVERREFPSFARKYRAHGLPQITADRAIIGIWIGGMRWHLNRPAPRNL